MMTHVRGLLFAVLSSALLAACAQGATSGPDAGLSPIARLAPGGTARNAHGKGSGPTLYVLNLNHSEAIVSVYSAGGATFVRDVNLGRYKDLFFGFSVDASGTLYGSAEYLRGVRTLSLYTDQGATLVRTIHQKPPFGWVNVDSSKNVYATCGVMCEYAGAKLKVAREFRGWGPAGVDSSGNVAVVCDNGTYIVCVLAPGRTQASWGPTGGISYAIDSVAFDPSGNLYVANGFSSSGSGPGSVAVFTPQSGLPVRTIANGIADPTSLAFDAAGDLYVYNLCASPPDKYGRCQSQGASVSVYPPGASDPTRTITQGVDGDRYTVEDGANSGLALDSSGMLYVANRGDGPGDPGSVTVYAAGGNSVVRTVTKHVHHPVAVAVGP